MRRNMRDCTLVVSRRTRGLGISSVSADTRDLSGVALIALAQPVTPHDLQEARMIRQAESLCGSRDVPVVLVQRAHHDLSFGLRSKRPEGACWRGRIAPLVLLFAKNFWRGIGGRDHGGVGRDHHPLEAVSQLAHVVLLPAIR